MPEMTQKGTITLTSTGIRIEPYKRGDLPMLEYVTSTTVPSPKGNRWHKKRVPFTGLFVPYKGKKEKGKSQRNQMGYFVTHHHDTFFLQNNCPGYVMRIEPMIRPQRLSIQLEIDPEISFTNVQSEVAEKVISAEKEKQWFIYLSQGLGKTLLSIYLISYFKMKTIVICFRKIVLEHWIDTLVKNTNMPGNRILLINSSELLNRILKGKFDATNYDIFLCTPTLLDSFGKSHGHKNLNKVFSIMGIGMKIFDEAHRNIGNMITINAFTNVEKTLYLSGDFAQSNDFQQKEFYKMFYNVPIIRANQELLNTLKYTVAIVITFNTKPSEMDNATMYQNYGFSYFEYMRYEMQHPTFMATLSYILDMIVQTNAHHYKVLVLVNLIEHVDTLQERLDAMYHDTFRIGGYHHQKPEDEKEFCKKDATLIVSTYQAFSTGVDVSNIKYVISCSLCSKIDDNQASGRARPLSDNSDAFYFMMVDYGFQYGRKTLSKRLAYLQDTKIKRIERYDLDL